MKKLPFILLFLFIAFSGCDSCFNNDTGTLGDEAGAPADGEDEIPEATRVATLQGVGLFTVGSVSALFSGIQESLSVSASEAPSADIDVGVACVPSDDYTSFHCTCENGEGYYDAQVVSGAWGVDSCQGAGDVQIAIEADPSVTFNLDFHDCKINDCSQDLTLNGQAQMIYQGFDNDCDEASDLNVQLSTADSCSGMTATTEDGLELTIGYGIGVDQIQEDGEDEVMTATLSICVNGDTEVYNSIEEFQDNVDPTGVCTEDEEENGCGSDDNLCQVDSMTFVGNEVENGDTITFTNSGEALYFDIGSTSADLSNPVLQCTRASTEDYYDVAGAQVSSGLNSLSVYVMGSALDDDNFKIHCFDGGMGATEGDVNFRISYTYQGEEKVTGARQLHIDLSGL